MARIVTVYDDGDRPFRPVDMSYIRWLRMSQALAALGHDVDIATGEGGWRRYLPARFGRRLRRVPIGRVRWERYDAVKTLFHRGYEALARHGGAGHPFVIAKLGSVVGLEDRPDVYFDAEHRAQLFETQSNLARTARFVTLLTKPSRDLFAESHGDRGNLLLVPGAVDAEIPGPRRDPYAGEGARVCLYAGNIYEVRSQERAHRRLVDHLNRLGARLARLGMRLVHIGTGDTSALGGSVNSFGPVPFEESWDYLHHAGVGLVLALGEHPNSNESTKIYHYLRVGLPTVCESGFPNEGLVAEARLGTVVANGDVAGLADAIVDAATRSWDRTAAIKLVRARHTWAHRAAIYDRVIARTLAVT